MRHGRALSLALLLVALLPLGAAHGQAAPSHTPAGVSVTVIPPVLPADGGTYPALVISLVDAGGAPTLSLSDVTILLSTTNSTIASVPSTATVSAGHNFVQVSVTTSTTPGTTTLTATGNGLATKQVPLQTVVPTAGASILGLYTSPDASLLALQGSDGVYAVELQTAGGKPGTVSAATDVMITSSNGSLIPRTIDLTIPAGSSVAYGAITVNDSGTATLTAIAHQLATGTAKLVVASSSLALGLTVTPAETPISHSAEVTATLTVLGMPVPGANVTLTVTGGSLLPTAFSTDVNGQGSATYVPGNAGGYTITATAVDPKLGISLKTTALVIVTSTATVTTSSPGAADLVMPYLPFIIVVVVAVVLVMIVRRALKRRKGATEEDEDEWPEPQAGAPPKK